MELNKIQSSGSWGKAADDLNQNFSKVNNAVEQVKNATTRNKGYFSSDTELKSAFPSANVGDIAYVGNSYPYAIWKWNGSAWAKSGSTGGEESVNLGDYYTKVDTDEKFGSKIQDVIHPIYNEGYINFDTLSVSGSRVVTISRRMRIRISKSPFYVNVPAGDYTIQKPSVSFYSLVFNTESNELSFVDSRYVKDSQIVIASIQDESAVFGVNSIVSDVRVNGVSLYTRMEHIEKQAKGLEQGLELYSDTIHAIYYNGYINIDSKSQVDKYIITFSKNLRIRTNVDPLYINISEGEYIVDRPTVSYYALAYDIDSESVKFVDYRNVTPKTIVLACLANNADVWDVNSLIRDVRINGESMETRLSGLEDDYKKFMETYDKNKKELASGIETNSNSFVSLYRAVYGKGIIDINTTYTSTTHLISLSERIRLRLLSSPYYKDIAKGEYEISKPSGSFVSLVYSLSENLLKYIDSRYTKTTDVILANFSNENPLQLTVTDSVIECRLNGVSDRQRIEKLEDKVSREIDSLRAIKASAWESTVKSHEQYLRFRYKESGEQAVWYGVEWKEERNANNVFPINSVGNEELHTTLPIQSRMRRCVTKNGVVQYYLHSDNSEIKEDGTDANLDGTDGNVMVEIPEFFFG